MVLITGPALMGRAHRTETQMARQFPAENASPVIMEAGSRTPGVPAPTKTSPARADHLVAQQAAFSIGSDEAVGDDAAARQASRRPAPVPPFFAPSHTW